MRFPLLILMVAMGSAILSLFMAPRYNLTMCESLVPGFLYVLGIKISPEQNHRGKELSLVCLSNNTSNQSQKWASTRDKNLEVDIQHMQLCSPMDCSPPGSTVHGILQARILKWVAIPFSRGSFPPRDRSTYASWVSCISSIGSGFFTTVLSGKDLFIDRHMQAQLLSCV